MSTKDARDSATDLAWGHHLRAIREGRGWTQEQLAEKTGLDASTITHLEMGRQRARSATVQLLQGAMPELRTPAELLEQLKRGVAQQHADDREVEVTSLREQNQHLQQQMAAVVAERDHLKAQVAVLQQRNSELDEQGRQQQARLRELEGDQATLTDQALIDSKTGLYNDRYLAETMPKEVARSHRTAHPLSMLMIDVDHFKQYNDTHGHVAGDVLLRRLAKSIMGATRNLDHVVRCGGEEFAVVLSGADEQRAAGLAERIRGAVENLPAEPAAVTVSIGVATYYPEGEYKPQGAAPIIEQLKKKADEALYVAKRSGRNRVHVFGEPEPPAVSEAPAVKQPAPPSEPQHEPASTQIATTAAASSQSGKLVVPVIAPVLSQRGASNGLPSLVRQFFQMLFLAFLLGTFTSSTCNSGANGSPCPDQYTWDQNQLQCVPPPCDRHSIYDRTQGKCVPNTSHMPHCQDTGNRPPCCHYGEDPNCD